jgi:tetratricopeptide (TPR) repeat protein
VIPQPTEPVEVFYSYSHKDENLRNKLEEHLSILKHLKVIANWHDRKILAGKEWDGEIDKHLETAQVILLLISPSFMSSDYCYDIEVTRAMERHKAGKALVIPIFLRPVMWKGAPFGELQGLPTDAKPVTDWSKRDKAFLNIAEGIRKAVESMASGVLVQPPVKTTEIAAPVSLPSIIFRPLLVDFVARRNPEGRDIVELLKEELVPEGNKVIVLWGPGGVGKTTLAIQAARELSDDFEKRIVWASPELRSDLTLNTLLDEIATQLGRDDLRQLAPEPKEAAVRALMAAAPTLVILDNFETIAHDEQQPCANWLVQRALCSAIITTRQRVMGARNVSIDAMSLEEAREFLEHLIRQSSEPQVFDAHERDRIIQAAGANPLVMQWIVAQIDLALSLSDVLDDLVHGKGDAAQRVFNRSFELEQLGDDGRTVLLALSLFIPSASRPALAEVAGLGCDMTRLNEAVKRLASLRLIGTTEGGERLTIQGLTRELAKARLAADTRADEFRQRFVAYFLSYVKEHAQPTPEDYDALEVEKDNVLGAMDIAFAMENWSSVLVIANELANPVTGMLSVRGYWDEAIQRGEQAVVAAQTAENEWAVAQFAGNVATIRMGRGEYDEAKQIYQHIIGTFKKLDSKANVASCLHMLGRIEEEKGEFTKAQQLYNESLEIKKRIGDQTLISNTLHHLAILAQKQGELIEAKRLFNEALETEKKIGRSWGIPKILHQLAMLAQEQGELAEARRLYNESLEIKKKLGDRKEIAITLGQLGLLAEEEGNKAEAVRLTREALIIFEKLKSPVAETARRNLARLEKESS